MIYIGEEVFGRCEYLWDMTQAHQGQSATNKEKSEPTPGIVELARECDGPRGPHEPDLLPVSSLIALIADCIRILVLRILRTRK